MNSRFPKNRIFLSIHKTLAAVLLVLLVFSDISRLPYFGEWLAQFSAFTIEKALAIAGDFSIYREQTGGEVVASTTVPLSVTWDTVVSENANITLQSGSSTVDLVEAGKYLVLYNVWTDEGAGGDERRNFETYLTLNGSEIPYGRGYGYLRDSGGDNDAYAAGIGIIEAGAGDDLEVVINRDDTNDETAGIRSGTNGVSVLRLKDDFDYLRIKKNTNTSGIQTATTFTDVIWDTTDEADTGSFGFTNGSGDITLKGAEGEHFLVSAGVGILQTYGDSTRQNYELRLTLDGAEIPGTRVTAYPRGNSNSDGIFQVSLIYSGIIQKTAAGDQTLNIEYRRESQSSSQSQITGADTSLAIVALPNTAHYISLTSTTSAQSYTSTPSAFTWNEQLEVDTTAFSHSTTTNNSRINIDLEGDYLFLSTAYATRTSGTARNVPVIDWRLDGTTGIQYGGHGSFNRGDQSTADAYTSGSSGGLIVPGLSDTQYIEVMVRDEALASPNAVFNPHHIAVQGVELSLLFQTNVDVAATGTHVATTSVPATDVYQGGSFVITENTGSRFISSIDLTESGAIDGSTGLENIKILYDLDTSDPYDCASESYGGGESQYGSTDANGFSGPDGVSSFSGSVTISTTQAFCGYVIYDVTDAATDGDTIEITIDNPSTDVAVTSGGTVSPAIPVGPSASTTVVSAELTQTHYRWLQDDGIEGAATAVEAEDTAAGGFANGAINRLRTQVYAAGSVSSAATTLQLDYATKTASCAAVSQWIDVGAVGGAWDMSNSTFIVDGTDATNIGAGSGGVSDPGGGSFMTTNTGLRDTSSQTSALTFANNEFAEFEFAIEPTTQAVEGTTYCFRVSDSGTALRNYDVYAEGTVSADITVSATSTQVSTLDLGTTAQYVGGGFVFQRSGTSRTLTSITVTETGTVDAGEHLRNPRLYYDIDTTSPYDCTGETYAPSDGFVSGSPFTGPDGSTTFTGSVALNSTQSFCGYLVVDIAATSTNGETINVEISDPSTEVVVTSSTVGPSTAVSPTGSTTIAGPILTQTGFHWRNDDGVESGATSATGGSEDTALQNVPRDTIYRLRLLVSNEGAVTSASTQYQVEYGTKITTCADVGSWQAVDSGVAFTMGSTSQLVDGNNTTDIAVGIGGVTNPGGKTLLASNGGQKEVDDQTSGVALTSAQFVELEYALEVTDQSGYDTTYCFRVTDAGTPLPAYDTYAELTTSKKQDFFVQRGTEIVSGTGTVMIAGVHYTAPAATNTAFVRITTSQLTGAGNNTGGGNQNADDVTAHIEYLTDITDSFSIVRPSTATGVTRVDWELVEYVGLEGADNEIIVRDVGTINYGTASLSVTGGLSSGVVDDGDIAVFITGQSNNAANATSYAAGQSTAAWNAGADRPVFTRASNGVTGEVSYAVVEFIGLNWDVQRTEHNYAASGVTETNSITAVNSLSRAFVHAQKRHSNEANLDAYGHKVWLSSIGAVSFRLNSGAGTPGDHYSVAWVIENKQTGTGEMNVYRDEDSVDGSEAVEPRTSVFNFNGTVSSMSNASLFISNDSTGNGTAFPRAMLGASVTSTTQYEIFESDAGQTQDFHVAVVEWPVAEVTFAQNYYRFYADNDTLTPTDPWPIGGVDLGENTSITSTDDPLGEGEVARIRMTLLVNNATFPESTESFKLQYGKRDGPSCAAISIWTDVGAPGSGEVWRGYDGTPADGDEVPSTLISIADIAASYEESNNSAVNPNVADPGDDVEFDWTIEHNGATQRTDYCFRMVKSDGAELQTYNNYPTLRTTGYTPVSNNWRWFGDEVSETPSASLASENVAPVDVVQGDIVKLRVGVKEVENASGANVKFALQYSEYSDFSQAVYTLTATSSCVGSSTWCYADGAGVDNAVISTTTISGVDACTLGVGNGCGMHNESANVGASPHAQPANSEMEFEFTLQHVAARANAVYYFRLYDITNDDPVVASSTYPSLVTEGAQLVSTLGAVSSSTVVAGITADVDTTPTSIGFGSIPFGTSYEAVQRMTIVTNGTQGYQLLMYATQQLTNSYGETIPAVIATNASPAGWSTACSGGVTGCFGYHTTDATLEGGSGRFAPIDSYAALDTTPQEIMYSSIPATDVHDIVYRIQVNEEQPAGDYETTIVYISVPVF